MNKKKINRIRRGRKTRMNIRRLNIVSLLINKTSKHIYAQLIDISSNRVLTEVSTVQKDISNNIKYTGNIEAAAKVGEVIAKKAMSLGINRIAFDRNGFNYHGRVKVLAESARKSGLIF